MLLLSMYCVCKLHLGTVAILTDYSTFFPLGKGNISATKGSPRHLLGGRRPLKVHEWSFRATRDTRAAYGHPKVAFSLRKKGRKLVKMATLHLGCSRGLNLPRHCRIDQVYKHYSLYLKIFTNSEYIDYHYQPQPTQHFVYILQFLIPSLGS